MTERTRFGLFSFTNTVYLGLKRLNCQRVVSVLAWIDGSEGAVWYWRCHGATVGKRCVLHECTVYEPEQCMIGDGTVMEARSLLHPLVHVDGKLQVRMVRVGARCWVQPGGSIIWGAE